MRVRLAGVLVAVAALCAVLAGAAVAQQPPNFATPEPTETATPTPEPTPTPEEKRQARLRKRKIVKRVYRDYEKDGRVDACEHSRTALKRTLESINDEYDAAFPDFREAVRAALKDYKQENERCAREEAEAEATPTPTPTSTPTPTPAPTAAPTTSPPSSDGGSAAPPPPVSPGSGGGGGDKGGAKPPPEKAPPPSEGDVSPVQPSPTPSPTATPAGPPETRLVVTRPGDRGGAAALDLARGPARLRGRPGERLLDQHRAARLGGLGAQRRALVGRRAHHHGVGAGDRGLGACDGRPRDHARDRRRVGVPGGDEPEVRLGREHAEQVRDVGVGAAEEREVDRHAGRATARDAASPRSRPTRRWRGRRPRATRGPSRPAGRRGARRARRRP